VDQPNEWWHTPGNQPTIKNWVKYPGGVIILLIKGLKGRILEDWRDKWQIYLAQNFENIK
jgi:hypothetical protein